MSYDPQPDGNCQFAAVAELLHLFAIHRLAQMLRAEVFSFLHSNSHAELLSNFRSFVPGDRREYVNNMGVDVTHGDHITSDVMLRVHNVQFLVLSNTGPHATQLISWDGNV